MRNAHVTKQAAAAADEPSVRALLDQALAMLRRRAWLLAALAPFALFWIVEFSKYASLADPIFGGDAWQQMGITYHIYNGHAPWTDAYFQGEWAFRDWLMYAVIAGLAKLTTLDPLRIAIYWPLVPLMIGGVAAYFLGKRMFAHEGIAVAMSVAWMGVAPLMAFQSSNFGAMAMVPLFLLALASHDGGTKRGLVLGLAYGAASLSYVVAFFGCSAMLAVAFCYHWWKHGAAATLRASWPVAAVAAPIVLALWGPLLLVYHGHVLNASYLYCDSCLGWSAGQAVTYLVEWVFDISSVFAFAYGCLAAFGIYAAAKHWESRGGKWAFLVLGVGLVGTYQYLVTMPLFHTHLVFFRWPKEFMGLAKLLFAGQAIAFLAWDRHNEEHNVKVVAAALVFVIVAGAFGSPAARSSYADNAKVHDENAQAVQDTAKWARQHLAKDAVVLALPEESFAFNGLTGINVVTARRSHANTFVDMDQRMADAAVMIYGTDRAKARALMDQYHVTNLYVGWFYEDNQAQEPITTSPQYAQYWKENGIKFDRDNWPLDVSGQNVELFDLLLVNETGDSPPVLQDFTPIHTTMQDGKAVMTIYERKA